MARPVIVLAGLVVAALIIGALFWLRPGAENTPTEASVDTISERPITTTAQTMAPGNTPVPAPVNSSDAAQQAEPEVTETPEEPLSKAMESMSQSLSSGDPRTPELAPTYEREKPAPEVLADPQRYAEYEEAQSRNIASVYLSMLNQIPTLRARIDAARASGSQSPEDIAEAEEALAKLEELKREIETTHPEMLQPADQPLGDDENSTPPE